MRRRKNEVCQACGICIGPEFMEKATYQVGRYQICGWCLRLLYRSGEIQVEPYNRYIYLLCDGSVIIKGPVIENIEAEKEAEYASIR
ncbi:hypothetical protein ACFLXC_03170 [Chloroflexota bacterium]